MSIGGVMSVLENIIKYIPIIKDVFNDIEDIKRRTIELNKRTKLLQKQYQEIDWTDINKKYSD